MGSGQCWYREVRRHQPNGVLQRRQSPEQCEVPRHGVVATVTAQTGKVLTVSVINRRLSEPVVALN